MRIQSHMARKTTMCHRLRRGVRLRDEDMGGREHRDVFPHLDVWRQIGSSMPSFFFQTIFARIRLNRSVLSPLFMLHCAIVPESVFGCKHLIVYHYFCQAPPHIVCHASDNSPVFQVLPHLPQTCRRGEHARGKLSADQ